MDSNLMDIDPPGPPAAPESDQVPETTPKLVDTSSSVSEGRKASQSAIHDTDAKLQTAEPTRAVQTFPATPPQTRPSTSGSTPRPLPTPPAISLSSTHTFPLNPLCPLCASDSNPERNLAAILCPSSCARVLYCSSACAALDDAAHLPICAPARLETKCPSFNHRRAFLFDPQAMIPKLVWLDTSPSTDGGDDLKRESLKELWGEDAGDRDLKNVMVDQNVKRLRRIGGVVGEGGQLVIMWSGKSERGEDQDDRDIESDSDSDAEESGPKSKALSEIGTDEAQEKESGEGTQTEESMSEDLKMIMDLARQDEEEDLLKGKEKMLSDGIREANSPDKLDHKASTACSCSDSECGMTDLQLKRHRYQKAKAKMIRMQDMRKAEKKRRRHRTSSILNLLSKSFKAPSWLGKVLVFAVRHRETEHSPYRVRDLEIAEFRDVIDVLGLVGPGMQLTSQENLVVDVAKLPPGKRTKIETLRCTSEFGFGTPGKSAVRESLYVSDTQLEAIMNKGKGNHEELTFGNMIDMPLHMFVLKSQVRDAASKKWLCHSFNDPCGMLRTVGVFRWHGLDPYAPNMAVHRKDCPRWAILLRADGKELTHQQFDAIFSLAMFISTGFEDAFNASETKSEEVDWGNDALLMATKSGYLGYFKRMKDRFVGQGITHWKEATPY